MGFEQTKTSLQAVQKHWMARSEKSHRIDKIKNFPPYMGSPEG